MSSFINNCGNGIPGIFITGIIPSTSTNSIMCGGHDQMNNNIVAKITAPYIDSSFDNSAFVEQQLNIFLTTIVSEYTPHIIPLVHHGQCIKFLEAINRFQQVDHATIQYLKTSLHIIGQNELLNSNDLIVIITKHDINKKSLREWLQQEYISMDDIDKKIFMDDILFQIAYTLLVFQDFGIIHNDLHTGNIMIAHTSVPSNLRYDIDSDTSVQRSSRYSVSIGNFSRGSKVSTSLESNTLLNTLLESSNCKRFGECNEFRYCSDWYRVIADIYMLTKDPMLLTLAKHLKIDNPPLYGKSCNCIEPDCTTCRTFVPHITSLKEYIKHSYRTDINNDTGDYRRPYLSDDRTSFEQKENIFETTRRTSAVDEFDLATERLYSQREQREYKDQHELVQKQLRQEQAQKHREQERVQEQEYARERDRRIREREQERVQEQEYAREREHLKRERDRQTREREQERDRRTREHERDRQKRDREQQSYFQWNSRETCFGDGDIFDINKNTTAERCCVQTQASMRKLLARIQPDKYSDEWSDEKVYKQISLIYHPDKPTGNTGIFKEFNRYKDACDWKK